jgi:hypothetical protein
MKDIVADPNLVAYCGLYCGACKKYLADKCPGCRENEKATWCGVRACGIENNFTTCADCTLLSFMAKVFGFIFRSDRAACIRRIREIGTEQYAAEMAEQQMMTIRR